VQDLAPRRDYIHVADVVDGLLLVTGAWRDRFSISALGPHIPCKRSFSVRVRLSGCKSLTALLQFRRPTISMAREWIRRLRTSRWGGSRRSHCSKACVRLSRAFGKVGCDNADRSSIQRGWPRFTPKRPVSLLASFFGFGSNNSDGSLQWRIEGRSRGDRHPSHDPVYQ
jgi:hypothetical protein